MIAEALTVNGAVDLQAGGQRLGAVIADAVPVEEQLGQRGTLTKLLSALAF